MTDTYVYGEKKQTIISLCERNPGWTSRDLMRETGWSYPTIRTACRNARIKLPSAYISIPIDRNIPMPKIAYGIGKTNKYPWPEMKIGDSFLFPPKVAYSSAHGNARDTGKRLGKRFAIRWTADGLRCWRTA